MKKIILLVSFVSTFCGLSSRAQDRIQTQCDSVAANSARLANYFQLQSEGVIVAYPGPEVDNFKIMKSEEEYQVAVGGPKPGLYRVKTAQKSYYCAVMALETLQR